MQNNLSYAIYDAKHGSGQEFLTEKQRFDILSFVGKGCRKNTKESLNRKLNFPLSLWKDYGIYTRIFLSESGAEYCCGQSWNEEMHTLRQCILKF